MRRIECVLEAAERAEAAREIRKRIVDAFWSDPQAAGERDLVFVPGVDFDPVQEEYIGRDEAAEAVDELNESIAKLLREGRLAVEMEMVKTNPLQTALVVPLGVKSDPEAWLWRSLIWALEAQRHLRECRNCKNLFQVGQNNRVIYCSDNCKYNADGRVSFKPKIKGIAARNKTP